MIKASLALTAGAVLGYFWLTSETPNQINVANDPAQASPNTPSTTGQSRPQTAPHMPSAQAGIATQTTDIPSHDLGHHLLVPSEQAEDILYHADVLPADLNGEVYITFNRAKIHQLKAKDVFSIPIPQLDQPFDAVVEEIIVHRNGDRTIRAKLINLEGDLSATITQGEKATYATINTPEGVFVLEALGENGFVAAKQNLRQRHNFEVTDAIVPPDIQLPTPPVRPVLPNTPQQPRL